MPRVDLSAFTTLQPQPPEDLCRIGSEFDGGYVVSRCAILESRHLLSFGISYDVNFEYDFVNSDSHSRSAYMYDASTKPFSPEYIFSITLNCLRFVSYRPMMHYLAFLKKRKRLLSSGCAFHKVNVSNSEINSCVTLTKALIEITEEQERTLSGPFTHKQLWRPELKAVAQRHRIELFKVSPHWRELPSVTDSIPRRTE